MTDTNNISPSSIDSAGQSFDQGSSQLSEDIGGVQSRIDALSGCWGDDKPGQAFGCEYQEHAEKLLEGCRTLSQGLQDIADRLHQMATAVEDLDHCDRG